MVWGLSCTDAVAIVCCGVLQCSMVLHIVLAMFVMCAGYVCYVRWLCLLRAHNRALTPIDNITSVKSVIPSHMHTFHDP
ncbi:hypothetical protein EJ02DRAFT_117207 [Clathrospora elynae]|uniref:Uncharacterized protein n=1 Tax=Clathrospora elynae TaxID=706981 RepID=A0A6A5SB86_9PLEO|nr:hypothetical protein EJ02DRAFT_117207 [Clathrospora elynae]